MGSKKSNRMNIKLYLIASEIADPASPRIC